MVPEEKDSSRSRVSLVESDGSAGQPAATRGGQSFACKTCVLEGRNRDLDWRWRKFSVLAGRVMVSGRWAAGAGALGAAWQVGLRGRASAEK